MALADPATKNEQQHREVSPPCCPSSARADYSFADRLTYLERGRSAANGSSHLRTESPVGAPSRHSVWAWRLSAGAVLSFSQQGGFSRTSCCGFGWGEDRQPETIPQRPRIVGQYYGAAAGATTFYRILGTPGRWGGPGDSGRRRSANPGLEVGREQVRETFRAGPLAAFQGRGNFSVDVLRNGRRTTCCSTPPQPGHGRKKRIPAIRQYIGAIEKPRH